MFKIHKTRSKFRKKFRTRSNRTGSLACFFPRLSQGMLGLRATSGGLIPMITLIAFYQEINKRIKKHGVCRIFAFPNRKKTTKKSGCRMGQGKGTETFYFCRVHVGMLLCLVTASTKSKGVSVLHAAQYKLNISCSIIEY